MRDIIVIINDICKIACYHNNAFAYEKEEFLMELNKIKRDMMYAAPEYLNSPHFFQVLGNVLNKHISPQDYREIEWCREIIDIFRDPNYKL
jgi:superfamily II DNA helicase RecQ